MGEAVMKLKEFLDDALNDFEPEDKAYVDLLLSQISNSQAPDGLVERVARAICLGDGCPDPDKIVNGDPQWLSYGLRARMAISAMQPQGWRPISEIPLNTPVVVQDKYGNLYLAELEEDKENNDFMLTDNESLWWHKSDFHKNNFTFYQFPLPPAPKDTPNAQKD